MKDSLRTMAACVCMACSLASQGLQGAADFGTSSAKAASRPAKATEPDDSKFESTFAKAMMALKAKSFEEARLLFIAAADSTDIMRYPLSWQTAEFNACHILSLQGRKPEAMAMAKQIANRCEAALGEEDPLTNESLAHLAFVLKQCGHLEQAEPVYRRNLQLLEAKYGPEHYAVAQAMCKHANLLQSLGKLRDAENLQRKAFEVMQRIGNEEHPNFCYFLTNLAYCLQATHKPEEANKLMAKAYEIVENTSDSDLSSAGSILRKQAEFYRDQKQLDRAEALGHRALLRLAKRSDINRARFFYYDLVVDVYRSILQAQGLSGSEIDARCEKVEAEAAAAKATANK